MTTDWSPELIKHYRRLEHESAPPRPLTEYDQVHNAYVVAKQAYNLLERDLAVARAVLNAAERDRTAVWNKLVAAAAVPNGERDSG